MKFKYVIIFSFALLIHSCDDFLDKAPLDQLNENTFYQTESDFVKAVNAIYNTLQSGDNYGSLMLQLDRTTPNAYCWDDWRKAQLQPHTGTFNSVWTSQYNTIAYANIALENIKEKDIAENIKNRCIGEASFLRALAYFNLTIYFGDVPKITKLQKSVSEYIVPRSPQSEIMTLIISDLGTAEQSLPSVKDYRGTNNLGRASKEAAKMLLVRLYMWQHDYENAAKKAKEIIDANVYKLVDNYNDLFWPVGDNSLESIFEVQFAAFMQEGTDFNNSVAPSGSGYTFRGGYGPIQVSRSLVDEFEINPNIELNLINTDPYYNYDNRLRWTVLYHNTPYSVEKFKIPYKGTWAPETSFSSCKYIIGKEGAGILDSPKNMIVMRYADLLLLYAEAQNELGFQSVAAQYVNMVRNRKSVNMPSVNPGLSKIDMRNAIRHERRIELGMEGIYLYDLLRWGTYLQEMEKEYPGFEWGTSDHLLLWPIPQDELDVNPSLTQNPGYN